MLRKYICVFLIVFFILLGCEKRKEDESSTQYNFNNQHLKRIRNFSFCSNGYVFLCLESNYGISIIQIWEDGPSTPRPMRCKNEKHTTFDTSYIH